MGVDEGNLQAVEDVEIMSMKKISIHTTYGTVRTYSQVGRMMVLYR